MANYPISHTLHVSDWLPQFVFLFEQSAKKRKSVLSSYSFSHKRERGRAGKINTPTQETTQERENGEVR